ncbi:lysine transporter LysE [Streptomyces sp. UC4497]
MPTHNHCGPAEVLRIGSRAGHVVRDDGGNALGVRRAAKGISKFLVETVGEAVAEVVLTLLACTLLVCLAFSVYLSWSFSPRVTVAGAGLLSLLLAHGAWRTFRDSTKGRRHRGLAAVTTAGFTLTAATSVFLLVYGTGCGCW